MPTTPPANAPTARAKHRLAATNCRPRGCPQPRPSPRCRAAPAGRRSSRRRGSPWKTLRDELQAYYDARTETWQESDRAATLAEQRDTLEQVLDDLGAVPPF